MSGRIKLDDLTFFGHGLNRPECVLAHSSGLLFAPDWTEGGGVSVLSPDGTRVERILARDWHEALRPNGIALETGGTFLLAHLGAETGGLFRLFPDGHVEPVLTELGGRSLPPSNFIYLDDAGRMWLTISTSRVPRALGYKPDVDDGFVLCIEDGQARIVAEGLGYTNEAVIHPDGKTLWVNETFAKRTTSFRIGAGGALTDRETIAEYGAGTFPDGLAFDVEGHGWITSIVSNRVIRVSPDGHQVLMVEDCDDEHLVDVETAFQAGTMGRPHLDQARSKVLKNISNLAFAGSDLGTACLGCLLGDSIATFRSLVPGAQPSHWTTDLGPLAAYLEEHELETN